ncbi:hypothetical protein [Rubellimicrobium arenae]|uniref:hypothetical protein n=1 Tax=Rubellimicrobium arenae TaxID=2817372 RepID=UPI001B303633|nr:hypothetical protein [Rubellimicrobium arenae]
MANGPQDYRDPKVTTTERRSSMNWLWYLIGAIIILALLGWLLGLFGGADDAATTTDAPATTNGAAATDGAATTGETTGGTTGATTGTTTGTTGTTTGGTTE